MHDALLVSGSHAARDLRCILDRFSRRKGPLQTITKRRALQQFRNDEGQALVCADIEHGQQIGMIDRSGGSSFLLETTESIGILGERRRQDLDRDVARDARVARAIHLAHPARPERGDDLVVTNPGTGSENHGTLHYQHE